MKTYKLKLRLKCTELSVECEPEELENEICNLLCEIGMHITDFLDLDPEEDDEMPLVY